MKPEVLSGFGTRRLVHYTRDTSKVFEATGTRGSRAERSFPTSTGQAGCFNHLPRLSLPRAPRCRRRPDPLACEKRLPKGHSIRRGTSAHERRIAANEPVVGPPARR